MTESQITLPVALLSEVVKFEAGPLKEILADIDKSFGISGLTLSVDWEDTYNKLKPSDRSNGRVQVRERAQGLLQKLHHQGQRASLLDAAVVD